MMRFILFICMLILPLTTALAQLPDIDARDTLGRKTSFRPLLGRVAVYNEIFGLGIGHSFNIEASPIMTDVVTMNIRCGTGRPIVINAEDKDGFNMVYGVGVDIGRRRSRFVLSAGLWNVIVPPYIRPYSGDTTDTRIEFNWFGSLGYRYQAPKGFFFGINVYLMAVNSDYTPKFNHDPYGNEFSVWPSTYMGYRIPSAKQHRAMVAYARLSKTERVQIRNEARQERASMKLQGKLLDSTSTVATGKSEFGLTFFGPALLTLNYTLYVPFKENGIANYYLRSGLGTAMPLFQWNMETGMAFLKKNSGVMVGGGGALSFGENSLEAFVVLRGKVNIGKGFSGNAGLMVLWSTGAPYTFIQKGERPHVLPSIGFAFRMPRSRR